MESEDDNENDSFDSMRQKMGRDAYYVTPLHDHPEMLNDCCTLINAEWKRSLVARARSIGGSCDNFPASLVLLKESEKPVIVGHCKLSKISHSSPVVFVDTVVIHPDYRGRGLGRFLMQRAEVYVQRKGIKWIYLTTMGQEMFYTKLGYSVCDPINIYGGQLNLESYNNNNNNNHEEEEEDEKALRSENKNLSEETRNIINKQDDVEKAEGFSRQVLIQPISPPPPPPPPPPPMPSFRPKVTRINSSKTFMRKQIS